MNKRLDDAVRTFDHECPATAGVDIREQAENLHAGKCLGRVVVWVVCVPRNVLDVDLSLKQAIP